jgi:5-formyltetrahydrofolate cyclo-ligase
MSKHPARGCGVDVVATMSDASVEAAKSRLRASAKIHRSMIAADAREGLSQDAAGRVAALLRPTPGHVVSAFLSFGGELDTRPAIAALVEAGHPVGLPVMQGKAKPLLFRRYRPGDALRTVQWGIQEPHDTAELLVPDVLLVPLLAFDRAGHRLGYGGGYYDRTLAALRQRRSVIAVGLAFDEQEVDAVPHLDYDERLDWVVTPARCLNVRT